MFRTSGGQLDSILLEIKITCLMYCQGRVGKPERVGRMVRRLRVSLGGGEEAVLGVGLQ